MSHGLSNAGESLGFKVFKNTILRMIFVCKEEGITEGCWELHNKTLCDLYLSNVLAY
jgi:hypothetical protein